jgi:hypothetical protein
MRDLSQKVVATLIAAADDSSVDVRDQVLQSFRVLAAKDLKGVVHAITDHLLGSKPSSGAAQQRQHLLRCLLEILKAHAAVGTLSPADTKKILESALGDMINVSELNSTWAAEASALFVHTCDLDPDQGVPMLSNAIPTGAGGTTPFFVLKTLTAFAIAAPMRLVPHLKDLLRKISPLLGSVKQDNPRMLFAQLLRSLAAAAIYLENHKRKSQHHLDPNEEAMEPLTPRSAACAKLDLNSFAESFGSCCTHLAQEWSKTSEQKVRGPVLAAIATMSATLEAEARVNFFPQLMNLVVNGVKREKPNELEVVAEGCAAICDVPTDDQVTAAIINNAESMLTTISQAVVLIQNDKNHQESVSGSTHFALAHLLRWAELVGAASVDTVVTYAGKVFDPKSNSSPALRAASIAMVGHLVSRKHLTASLSPYKDHVIATLKVVLNDNDPKVKRALANAIVSMAANDRVPFMDQVGAKDLLQFVIRCAASASDQQLKDQCRTALQVLASSQAHLDTTLMWPTIMEHMSSYAAEPELLNVFPTVVKCLTPLAERVAETDHFYVDFRINVNMPAPGMLVAILAAHAILLPPKDRRNADSHRLVVATLAAMEAIAPLLDEPFLFQHLEEVPQPVATLWLSSVPELKEMVKTFDDVEVNPEAWEELITKLVSRTVSARPEAEWVESIANGALTLMKAVIAMPPSCPEGGNSNPYSCCRRDDLLRAAFAVAGAALAKSPRRDQVAAGMDAALDVADPDRPSHRAGIARMLSSIATNKDYVDIVMERLSGLSRPPPEKKGFFANLVSKKDEKYVVQRKVTERSRAMSALGLTHCARRMPTAALASRLEASVAPLLQSNLTDALTFEVKELILSAMLVLAAPLKKLASMTDVPQFKARDALMESVLLTATQAIETRGKGGDPATALATANTGLRVVIMLVEELPALPVTAAFVDKFITFVISVVVPAGLVDPTGEPGLALLASIKDTYAVLIEGCHAAQRSLSLQDLVEPFYRHTAVKDEAQRNRSLRILIGILECYLTRAESELAEGGTTNAIALTPGTLFGVLTPRFTDPSFMIRGLCLDALQVAARVHAYACPQAFGSEGDVGAAVEAAEASAAEFEGIRARTVGVNLAADANRILVNKELSSLNKALCGTIVTMLPTPALFSPLLDVLLSTGLKDFSVDSVTSATVVLHGAIRGMGNLLSSTEAQGYVQRVVAGAGELLGRPEINEETVLPSLFMAVRNIAKHHQEACFEAVVKKHPPPHGPHVVRAIQAIAGDAALQGAFIKYCVDTMLNSPLLDEKGQLNTSPLSAACSIGWSAEVQKCEELTYEMRTTLLCVLAIYGSAVQAKNDAKANTLVGEATRAVVRSASSDVTRDRLERFGWGLFTSPNAPHETFMAAVVETIRYWADEDLKGDDLNTDLDRTYPFQEFGAGDGPYGLLLPPSEPSQTIVDVAEFIVPYAEKPDIAQRRVAVVIISRVLLRHSLGDDGLLQCLVTALLGRTGMDESPTLRYESLGAFGKLGLLAHDSDANPLKALLPPVLTSLLNNLDDDREPIIALKSTEVLRQALEVQDKSHVQQGATVNMMLKVKQRFEHPDPNMRCAAIGLFGAILQLAVSGHVDKTHPLQQANQYFVMLIAHSQEDNEQVRIVSRRAFVLALKLMTLNNKEASAALARLTDRSSLTIDEEEPSARIASFDESTLNEFGLFWVAHFAGKVSDLFTACIAYFESPIPALRLASASVSAVVLKHLPPEEFTRTNAEQLVAALMRLARSSSQSAELRTRASRALGWIPLV